MTQSDQKFQGDPAGNGNRLPGNRPDTTPNPNIDRNAVDTSQYKFDPMTGRPIEKKSNDKPADGSDNPYTFNDDERRLYGSFSLDNAIARAWSRGRRTGHEVGRPTSEINETDTLFEQEFLLAVASQPKENNPNQTVTFRDGRGPMFSESGI